MDCYCLCSCGLTELSWEVIDQGLSFSCSQMALGLELSKSLAGLDVWDGFFTHHVWHLSWNGWNCMADQASLSMWLFTWLTWVVSQRHSLRWLVFLHVSWLSSPPPAPRVSVLGRPEKAARLAEKSHSITSATYYQFPQGLPTFNLGGDSTRV